MTDLAAITALGGATPASRRFGALLIEENSAMALASLALRQGAAQPTPAGLALPAPGGWAGDSNLAAFWTGPDQWMIEGPGRADEDFAAAMALAGPGCSVTEQTDGFVVFEITSSGGAALLEALVSRLVNVDLAVFVPGSAIRTGFEHMSVFVIRRASDRMGFMAMRSAAGSVWHALTGAAARLEGEAA